MAYVIGGIAAAILIGGVLIYNKLVKLRNLVETAWSDIDVYLKKRYDLVPNLVKVIKGYASHEKNLFEEVTEKRAKISKADSPRQYAEADMSLKGVLERLVAVAENYPDLKADNHFLKLQDELSDIEDSIAYARRYYNAVVRDHNTLIESFPSNVIANMFRFRQEEFFSLEAPEIEGRAVSTNF